MDNQKLENGGELTKSPKALNEDLDHIPVRKDSRLLAAMCDYPSKHKISTKSVRIDDSSTVLIGTLL